MDKKSSFNLSKVFLWLLWAIVIIIFILAISSYVFSKPRFQNWAVDKISHRLSERLDATITIDSVSLDIYRGVKIWDVAVLEETGDTLMLGSQLSSTLTNNLYSLINNKLYLNDIYLKDIFINVNTKNNAEFSNWQKLFKKSKNNTKGDVTDEDSSSFFLQLNSIELENVKYKNKNSNVEQSISLEYGKILIDSLNIDSLFFSSESVYLRNPIIELYNVGTDSMLGQKGNEKSEINPENLKKQMEIMMPKIKVNQLKIEDGQVWSKNSAVVTGKREIDFNNLRVDNLNLDIEKVSFSGIQNSSFVLNNLSGILDEQIELINVSSSQFALSEKEIEISDFYLLTDNSSIKSKNTIKFRSVDDFKKFQDKVLLDIQFEKSVLNIEELSYLVPGMSASKLINKNLGEYLYIDGQVKGRVNNFFTKDLKLRISDKVLFNGKVRIRNITEPEKSTFSIEVDRMQTSMSSLAQIIPNFRPPENFYKLGAIDFNGRFDGLIYNLVAYGNLKTDLGKVDLDMQLDLEDGRNQAKYSGEIDLQKFDLAQWSGNPEFEKLTLKAAVKNGSGLVFNTANADLEASVQDFSFRGYEYNDLLLNGRLEKNQFDGKFTLKDPSADLDFDGNFLLVDNKVVGDFTTNINNLDLWKLNLSKDTISLSGDMDVSIEGSTIDDFIGQALFKDLIINRSDKQSIFKELEISSEPLSNGGRDLKLESESFNAELDGEFNLASLGNDVRAVIYKKYPDWGELLGLMEAQVQNNQKFRVDINIIDGDPLLNFFETQDLSIDNLSLSGNIDADNALVDLATNADSISFKNFKVLGFASILNSSFNAFNFSTDTRDLFINDREHHGVDLDATMKDQIINLSLDSGDLLDTIGRIKTYIKAFPQGDELIVRLEEEDWSMLGTNWAFNPRNSIKLGKKKIDISDFALTDGKRRIELKSRNSEDLIFHLADVDISLINPLVDNPKFTFFGESFVNFQVLKIFDKPSLQGSFVIPELIFNDEPYGALNLLVENLEDDKTKIDLNLIRSEDDQMVVFDGFVNNNDQSIDGLLTADNFKLSFFRHLILEGISETEGHFDLSCKVKGTLQKPRLLGRAIMHDCAVRVDYLGNKVFFDEQEVRINEKVIDVTGGIITDRLGNEAVLTGGLYHTYLTDVTMGLNISSDRFLLLDTDKKDNPAYYGTGIGSASVDFSGPFELAQINISATTGIGSNLSIPVQATVENYDESFIHFVETGTLLDSEDSFIEEEPALEGVNIEMNLTITPDALVNIIFDEQLNDVIKGRGTSNLRINIERTGAFDIFGQYVVEEGDYLFTAMGLLAKPFKVQRGGTITWTGDPLNAALDFKAVYSGLRTGVDVFLAEYLTAGLDDIEKEAKRKTDVSLLLDIGGSLYNPDINFDIVFPELQGELKSYADSKMRTLRANPTDLNDQVAGLLIFGSFLPSDNPLNSITQNNLIQTGYNTLSEFATNQLSFLLSGLVEEALIDNGLISGLDFQIGFSKNNDYTVQNATVLPDEVEVIIKPKFKNDRWSADLGTNYVRQDDFLGNDNYAYYDFGLEYSLTQDGRLKLKFFSKNDIDFAEQVRENQFGAGIRYRKEFGTLAEFKDVLKKQIETDLNLKNKSN